MTAAQKRIIHVTCPKCLWAKAVLTHVEPPRTESFFCPRCQHMWRERGAPHAIKPGRACARREPHGVGRGPNVTCS
jgi:hypothetical protein